MVAVPIVAIGQGDFCQERQLPYLGDVNVDSVIDISDIVTLANHYFGHTSESILNEKASDIDLNGRISLADVIYLVKGVFRVTGVSMKLRSQLTCCNVLSCGYPCESEDCTTFFDLSGAFVRVNDYSNGTVSQAISDSAGEVYVLLPLGLYNIVIYPPKHYIDSTITSFYFDGGLLDLGNRDYIDLFANDQIVVGYDSTYGENRLEDILQSIGATFWAKSFFEEYIVWLPTCLHVREAMEMLEQYAEIQYTLIGGYACLFQD